MFGKRSATSSQDRAFPILYDGWPLVYAPYSPAALHLLELVQSLPAEFCAWLALPGDPHAAIAEALPARVEFQGAEMAASVAERALSVTRSPVPDTRAGRVRWEQHTLPSIARQVDAQVLHITSLHAPLFSPVPVVLSPLGDFPQAEAAGFLERLRGSLGQGGFARVSAVLWPADLPAPEMPVTVNRLPPHTHNVFQQPQPRLAGLPESYLFAPDPPDETALELLAAAWSWTSAGLGEDWSLLVSGLDDSLLERLRVLCDEAGASGPVERATPCTPAQRAAVFQHAGAVLPITSPLPWADAFLHALVCARPLIAQETPAADARVGPAGYLVPPGDARALGAAALTVLVEEDLSERLTREAETRVNAWQRESFSARLGEIYRAV